MPHLRQGGPRKPHQRALRGRRSPWDNVAAGSEGAADTRAPRRVLPTHLHAARHGCSAAAGPLPPRGSCNKAAQSAACRPSLVAVVGLLCHVIVKEAALEARIRACKGWCNSGQRCRVRACAMLASREVGRRSAAAAIASAGMLLPCAVCRLDKLPAHPGPHSVPPPPPLGSAPKSTPQAVQRAPTGWRAPHSAHTSSWMALRSSSCFFCQSCFS